MPDQRFFLSSLLVLLMLATGCSGGGGSASGLAPVQTDSPESALRRTISTWEQGTGPALALIPQVAQTVSGTTGTASGTSLGTITFRDLSGSSWIFQILMITYTSTNQAEVTTVYYGGSQYVQIELTFVMAKSREGWVLDNFKVTKLPEVISTSPGLLRGIVTETGSGKPIAGALVLLSGTPYTASTDANGAYEFSGIPAGTYTLIVNRDGYVLKTITGIVVR